MPEKRQKAPSLMYEQQIHKQGYQYILGMDEVGRGAWAGPVTVGAVCLPLDHPQLRQTLRTVRDSKEMTPRGRTQVAEVIQAAAPAWGIGSADNAEIDALGINPATQLAMGRALDDACARFPGFWPDCLFLDAVVWPEMLSRLPQITMIDGDARSLTIAAASVIAKTARDAYMTTLDADYPHYHFGAHKGYGTAPHRAALREHGPCRLHRVSYRPIMTLGEGD